MKLRHPNVMSEHAEDGVATHGGRLVAWSLGYKQIYFEGKNEYIKRNTRS